MREKILQLRRVHVLRAAPSVKQYELPCPVAIRLFRADAVMMCAQVDVQPVEQLGR